MSEVWKFLTKPIFYFPAYMRTFCVGFVIFALTAYAGYWASLRLVVRYDISHHFEPLGRSEGANLQSSVEFLYQLEMSGIVVRAREDDLRKNLAWADKVRKEAPEDLTGVVDLHRALTYLMLSRLDQQEKDPTRQFQHTIVMDPTFPLAHQYFAFLLMMMGRYEEGIQENEKSQLLEGSSPEKAAAEAAVMREAFKRGGEKGYWQKTLELERVAEARKLPESQSQSISPGNVASVYALAGDKDSAFEWLDEAYVESDGTVITLLKVDPSFKSLHGDPRFFALLRRMGLPE